MLKNIRRNKRADATDIIVFVLITFFLAVSFIVVTFVNGIIKEDVIEGTALGNTSASESILDSFHTINTKTTQRGFVLFISIMMIGIFISAFLVRLHPAFIIIYIFILGFTIFMAAMLGNAYDDFTIGELESVSEEQGMITYIMEHIVSITLIVGALSMIVVFGKLFVGTPGGQDI